MAATHSAILLFMLLIWLDTERGQCKPNPACEEKAKLLTLHQVRYQAFRDLQDAILINLDAIETKTEMRLAMLDDYDDVNCSDTSASIIAQLQSLRQLVQSLGQNMDTLSTTATSCAQVQETRRRFGLEIASGVFALKVNRKVIRAYCDLETDSGGWTLLQRRSDDGTRFNRKWEEYKQGFGNPSSNYWLGNEVIHLMTSTGGDGGGRQQELRVEITDWNNTLHHVTYAQFSLGDERSRYALRLGEGDTIDGDLSESLYAMHHGKAFSTEDRHWNYYPCVNCPRHCQGAWWYACCYTANLNGRLMRPSNHGNDYEAARWYETTTKSYQYAKRTEMKFRPSGFAKRIGDYSD